MKKALITDWLDKYGGAERVLTAISEIYDFDYYYAYANQMPREVRLKTFAGKDVEVISSQYMRVKKFRFLMPFFPKIIKAFNRRTARNRVDLIISSSWAMSKGFTQAGAVHICYLQARNSKYVWEEADLYFVGLLKVFRFLKGYLQKEDVKAAQNQDYLVANSIFVQKWVKEKYGRESRVIYPPVDVEDFEISPITEDYYITVGRLEPYKRFDVVIKAFTENKKQLFIIGDGSQTSYLKSIAGENIKFLGYQNKNFIKERLSKAKAFVYGGVEDFGIVLVEALASGVPVIAYRGGASEEIVGETNGLLYNIQSEKELNRCIERFESKNISFDKVVIKKSAEKFSKLRFQNELQGFVDQALAKN